MMLKKISGSLSLLTLIPVVLFVMLIVYLITSDPNIAGPY